jgi:hypothetical protein
MSSESIEQEPGKNTKRYHAFFSYFREAIKPLHLFTLALVIVAGLQTCVLNNTDQTLRDTWKTNKISERAFVSIILAQNFLAPNLTDPKADTFGFNMINGGNTPTRDLKFTLRCITDDSDDEEPWGLLYATGDKVKHSPGFIGPKSAQAAYCSFTFDQMKEIAAKHVYGYVLADISYRDRLDPQIPRRTEMSLKIGSAFVQLPITQGQSQVPASVAVTFENQGKHNCADEECPAD